MRKTEVQGVAKILLSDGEYETAEDAATAIIKWLDADRAKRTSYVAVMQFGHRPGNVFYVGLGPYPGRASAEAAVKTHPAADEAYKVAVVPMTSDEGFKALIQKVDAPPPKGK